MLGKEFRKIRKAKKMSIVKVATGITSPSSLQRWECGEGEMSIDKVAALLKRMHIRPREYVDKLSEFTRNNYDKAVETAYINNDISTLKMLAITLLNIHQQDPKNDNILFLAATACNYYMDLTNNNLFPTEEIFRLELYFSSIKVWTYENMILLGNTQLLLSTSKICEFAKSLYNYFIGQTATKTQVVISTNVLLNAAFVLLKRYELDSAKKIIVKLDNLRLSEKYANEIMRIKFTHGLILYIERKNAVDINQLISNLESLGLTHKANDFKFAFMQIKKLYS